MPRANIAVALAHGLVPHPVQSWALVPFAIAQATRAGTYFVPLGGSNPIGTIGFVDAAAELAAQIEAGAMPEPDIVVTARSARAVRRRGSRWASRSSG